MTSSNVIRLNLSVTGDDELDYLHAIDGGGRFARVIRARVGSGPLAIPIAVKLERESSAGSARPGAAKFINEYATQIRVHQGKTSGHQTRVARLHQIWPMPEGHSCDYIPPMILCRHAEHALCPRCNECHQILDDAGRCLKCRAVRSDHDAILRSTAGRDAVCSNCPGRSDPAQCPVFWLNTAERKILLLELLDLDLEDYLKWRWSKSHEPPDRRKSASRFQSEHIQAVRERQKRLSGKEQIAIELDELRFLVGLFVDALNGVCELHAKGIAHLDIKPENLCLRLDAHRATLKVIDLGQSDDPNAGWAVRYLSLFDDAQRRDFSGMFSAPEQSSDRFQSLPVRWRYAEGLCQLTWSPDTTDRPCCGDWFYLPELDGKPYFRVVDVSETPTGVLLTAQRAIPGGQWNGGDPPTSKTNWSDWQPEVVLNIVRHAGYAADLHSLGMLLFYLLGRGQVDPGPFRTYLPQLSKLLKSKWPSHSPLPARAILRLISSDKDWGKIAKSFMPAQREICDLVRELQGLVIRAVVRGVDQLSYVRDRGDDGRAGVKQFLKDVQVATYRLDMLHQRHNAGSRVLSNRLQALKLVRKWLSEQKSRNGAERPAYRHDRIQNSLDALSGFGDHDEREFRYLFHQYRCDRKGLEHDLNLFEGELRAIVPDAFEQHPVLLKMLELLTPSPIATTVIEGFVAEAKNMTLATSRAETALQTLPRRKRVRVSATDIQPLIEAVNDTRIAIRSLEASLNTLVEGERTENNRQKEVLDNWTRLDVSHSVGGQRFRRFVDQQRDSYKHARKDWFDHIRKTIDTVASIMSKVDSKVVAYHSSRDTVYQRSISHRLRRFLSLSLGVRISFPDEFIQGLIAGLSNSRNSLHDRLTDLRRRQRVTADNTTT